MSTSTARKREKKDATRSSRSRKEYHDDNYEYRDSTPRGFGRQPESYSPPEEGLENLHLESREEPVAVDQSNNPTGISKTLPIMSERNTKDENLDLSTSWSDW